MFFFHRVWMRRFTLPGGLNVVLAPYDRAWAGCLDHELHDQRGLAPLARPVPGGEILLDRDPLDPAEGLEDLRRVAEGRRLGHGGFSYSRTPSQWVLGSDFPDVAAA